MPVTTIPLYSPPGLRPFRGLLDTNDKDSMVSGGLVYGIPNNVTQSSAYYVMKRSGLVAAATPASGTEGCAILASQSSTSGIVSAFGLTTSTIYSGTTSLGTMTGRCLHITETLLGTINYVTLTSNDNTGWFWASNALASFTGDTHTSTTIDNIATTVGLYVGQLLSGHADIAAGTRIATIASATSITVTLATLGTHSGITITATKLAKIINANFPTNIVGPITSLSGFFFVMTITGNIYQSAVNDITSWAATDFIPTNVASDVGAAAIRYKDMIVGFGSNSIEFFRNTGNDFGSVLSRVSSIDGVGVKVFATALVPICAGFDTIFFLDSAANLYKLDGLEAQKLTSYPEEIIYGSMDFEVSLSAITYIGQRIINIGVPDTNSYIQAQRWYLVDQNNWVKPNFSKITYLSTQTAPQFSPQTYAVDAGTSGKTFTLDEIAPISFQDNGSAYTMTIQTEPYYFNNGEPFIIDEITLLADTQASGSSTLSSTANDYANFGTIGNFDLTQQQKNLPCGGYYDSSVAFKLTDSGNQPWRGQGLKVKWRPYD